jgi:hypothetical protein
MRPERAGGRSIPNATITILDKGAWTRSLSGSFEDVVALQKPYSAELMTVRGPVLPTREKRA